MNIYIVTRHVTDSPFGTAIPNLGVYTNKRSANSHFEGVLQDRINRGATVIWQHYLPQQQYDNIIREALIKDGEEREHLKIELWRLKTNDPMQTM